MAFVMCAFFLWKAGQTENQRPTGFEFYVELREVENEVMMVISSDHVVDSSTVERDYSREYLSTGTAARAEYLTPSCST